MTNKFIKLTRESNIELYIQPMFITAMEVYEKQRPDQLGTRLVMMGGNTWHVIETVPEIQKKIQDLDRFVYHDVRTKNNDTAEYIIP